MSSENFGFKGTPPAKKLFSKGPPPPHLIPPTRLMWKDLDSEYGGKGEQMKENKLCAIGITCTSAEVFAQITESRETESILIHVD